MTAALKQCFFLSTLLPDQVKAMEQISQVRRLESGEMVFLEGEQAKAFCIVLEGQVQIYKLSKEGKEMILHLFGPGEIFAEVPVFCGLPHYPANALCLKPTELLEIQGNAFRMLAEENPDILMKMLMVFAKRLREFNELIADLSLRSVDSRLAKYLLSVSENTPDKAVIHVQKKTLAAILGTIPETLSRSFKKLSSDGVIAVKGAEVRLLDLKALKAMSDVDL